MSASSMDLPQVVRAEGVKTVVAVSRDGEHRFSKTPVPAITLVEGFGVEGDAHGGSTVQHLSRVARDPNQPNLRQVHLLSVEFLDLALDGGFEVGAGELGENILTRGIDLSGLGRDTFLFIGPDVVLRVIGLRNPCRQIDGFRTGLLALAASRDETGGVLRRAGVMSVVVHGGVVRGTDPILVAPPSGVHVPLQVV